MDFDNDKTLVIVAVLVIALFSFFVDPTHQEFAKQALAGLFGIAVGKALNA